MAKVWLVTGSGDGLGKHIVEAALRAGDKVVATSRQTHKLQDVVARHGDAVRVLPQDVTIEIEAAAAVRMAVDSFGRLDVLVNNAGYSRFGPFEQISDADFKGIVNTCFYGVVYTTRAALPVMRLQRSGVIFQVSSVGGRVTRPGNSPYHAAKWAVSGFSEALAQETAPFGVQVCSLEPGGIRTNWGRSASSGIQAVLPDYEESVGKVLDSLAAYWGSEQSDPRRIAELIVRLSGERELPPHLLLGRSAARYFSQIENRRQELARRWLEVTESVDFPEVDGMRAEQSSGAFGDLRPAERRFDDLGNQ